MAERKPTPEEARLWRQATTSVAPPKRKRATITAAQKAAKAEPASPPERFRDLLDPPPLDPSGARPEASAKTKGAAAGARGPDQTDTRDAPVRADHRRTPGLDKATASRLRRGQIPIDRRIDLHGMTRAEAHRVVTGAMAAASGEGERCLLVITGKGLRRGAGAQGTGGGDSGVLRAELPRWLAEPPQRERVLAVVAARPEHGGSGAVYVLLRRRR